MICNKIRYAYYLRRQCYRVDTTELEVCVLRTSDVKYGSKEIGVLNILYILNLVLLLTCSCQV